MHVNYTIFQRLYTSASSTLFKNCKRCAYQLFLILPNNLQNLRGIKCCRILFSISMPEFNIISYNVKGLRDKIKRATVLNFLKDKIKEGIVCLQETHSSSDSHLAWKKDWHGEMLWNDATSNSAGTGILIALPDYKILQNYQCGSGRLQILSIEINSKKFLIINLYNHNNGNGQVDLLVSLNDALAHFGVIDDHTIVISGDFNLIYDTSLDARGGNPTLKLRSLAQITKICDKYDLCMRYF